MNVEVKSRRKDPRVDRARNLRRETIDAERKLRRHPRALPASSHWRRQATIGPYFADFACHDARLVIEIDGGLHGLEDQAGAESKRTAYLEAQGYRVLRFWNNEVLGNIDGVLTVIAEALASGAGPHP
ncbi:endonuclease domain-containing protein [Rhodoplanes azumiensis]|uniref:Endonuclease domain-containing protein n=1 Tax=Rhodoplanes azumiensis TaxID=1897628 RepID=A0ABW5ALT6_9BRAD